MPALVILSTKEDLERLPKHFDSYEVLQLDATSDQYYNEARKTHIARNYYPVFYIPSNPILCSVVTSKLLKILPEFYITEWTGKRYRPLVIP